MSLITSVEHAYAVAASDIKKAATFVTSKLLPVLVKANAEAGTIEAVTALISPAAANIERVADAALGIIIKAVEDAIAAGNAGGVNVSLDAALVADVKAILPAVKAQAAPLVASISTPA